MPLALMEIYFCRLGAINVDLLLPVLSSYCICSLSNHHVPTCPRQSLLVSHFFSLNTIFIWTTFTMSTNEEASRLRDLQADVRDQDDLERDITRQV